MIYQNLNLIYDSDPDLVCVFGGNHIYKMDISQMLRFHAKRHAELTVAAIPVPLHEAKHFGIIEVDDEWWITGFVEKPVSVPKLMPNDPHHVLASMGKYVFERNALVNELISDAQFTDSDHDFGINIIPRMFPRTQVFVYDFSQNRVPGAVEEEMSYWCDVGTLDTYWESNMDLVGIKPEFNLY